jgi:hypothetical protein
MLHVYPLAWLCIGFGQDQPGIDSNFTLLGVKMLMAPPGVLCSAIFNQVLLQNQKVQ